MPGVPSLRRDICTEGQIKRGIRGCMKTEEKDGRTEYTCVTVCQETSRARKSYGKQQKIQYVCVSRSLREKIKTEKKQCGRANIWRKKHIYIDIDRYRSI